jgi:hypothetical protein
MHKKRRRKPPKIMPRLGPATNLRQAGAHDSLRRYNRKKLKAALRHEIAEGGFDFTGKPSYAAVLKDRNFADAINWKLGYPKHLVRPRCDVVRDGCFRKAI